MPLDLTLAFGRFALLLEYPVLLTEASLFARQRRLALALLLDLPGRLALSLDLLQALLFAEASLLARQRRLPRLFLELPCRLPRLFLLKLPCRLALSLDLLQALLLAEASELPRLLLLKLPSRLALALDLLQALLLAEASELPCHVSLPRLLALPLFLANARQLRGAATERCLELFVFE